MVVAGDTGGNGWPAASVAALPLYTLRLTTIFLELKPLKVWAKAEPPRPSAQRIDEIWIIFVDMQMRVYRQNVTLKLQLDDGFVIKSTVANTSTNTLRDSIVDQRHHRFEPLALTCL